MTTESLEQRIGQAIDLRDGGDTNQAIAALAEIIDQLDALPGQDDLLIAARGHLAVAYMKVERWQDAQAILERIAVSVAESSQAKIQVAYALYNLGSCLRQQGELSAAVQRLEEARDHMKHAGVSADVQATIDEVLVDAQHLEADILFDLGERARGMNLLDELVPYLEQSSTPSAKAATARALKERARKLLVENGPAAVAAADEIIATYKSEPDKTVRHAVAGVMGYKAYFFECGRRWQDALSVYEQILLHYGDDVYAETRELLGEVEERIGRLVREHRI